MIDRRASCTTRLLVDFNLNPIFVRLLYVQQPLIESISSFLIGRKLPRLALKCSSITRRWIVGRVTEL